MRSINNTSKLTVSKVGQLRYAMRCGRGRRYGRLRLSRMHGQTLAYRYMRVLSGWLDCRLRRSKRLSPFHTSLSASGSHAIRGVCSWLLQWHRNDDCRGVFAKLLVDRSKFAVSMIAIKRPVSAIWVKQLAKDETGGMRRKCHTYLAFLPFLSENDQLAVVQTAQVNS